MQWASTLSVTSNYQDGVNECLYKINSIMDNEPNLVVVFASPKNVNLLQDLNKIIDNKFTDCTILGCSGLGIIGSGQELEKNDGIAMAAATLPDVTVTPFHISSNNLPDGDAPPKEWESLVGVTRESNPEFILLGDPFSSQCENLLMGLDYAFPGSTIIGGLSSGGQQSGLNSLFLNSDTFSEGVVGAALSGNIKIDTIVAQGCKPIGEPIRITRCNRNLLEGIDDKPPFEVLKNLFSGLSESDQRLFNHSLFLGIVMDPFNETPRIGDFLIRNILGGDEASNRLIVGSNLKEGQIIQFHLRDSITSSENLQQMLSTYSPDTSDIPEGSGALLFSCLGRGQYLYEEPNHDSNTFSETVGGLPLTGFFCNGEIGPVGASTFLHGYTSAFGIIKPKTPTPPTL